MVARFGGLNESWLVIKLSIVRAKRILRDGFGILKCTNTTYFFLTREILRGIYIILIIMKNFYNRTKTEIAQEKICHSFQRHTCVEMYGENL